jgi:alpha-beta hydrolase superfamily lysophospholipase
LDVNSLILNDSIGVMEILASTADKTEEVQARLKMSDGFELFYRQWKPRGEADKVVVCLHGVGGHSGLFKNIGPGLAIDRANVYAIDRRGFGNSVEQGYERGGISSFDKYLRDTDESVDLIRRSNPGKKLFVFGKSEGCIHALRYGAKRTDSLDGLILAAPPITTDAAKLPVKLLLRMIFLMLFSQKTMVNSTDYMSEKIKESDEFKMALEDPLATQKFSVRFLKGVLSFRKTAIKNAPLVQKPTLVVQGDVDNIVEPTGARKLMEALGAKDKSLKTFPDADHNFYDAMNSRTSSTHDPSKRVQVINSISEWMRNH